jgi:hypothetical protein
VRLRPARQEDGGAVDLPAGLTVFRMGADGKLALARKYEIDVGRNTQWWTGIIPLHEADGIFDRGPVSRTQGDNILSGSRRLKGSWRRPLTARVACVTEGCLRCTQLPHRQLRVWCYADRVPPLGPPPNENRCVAGDAERRWRVHIGFLGNSMLDALVANTADNLRFHHATGGSNIRERPICLYKSKL